MDIYSNAYKSFSEEKQQNVLKEMKGYINELFPLKKINMDNYNAKEQKLNALANEIVELIKKDDANGLVAFLKSHKIQFFKLERKFFNRDDSQCEVAREALRTSKDNENKTVEFLRENFLPNNNRLTKIVKENKEIEKHAEKLFNVCVKIAVGEELSLSEYVDKKRGSIHYRIDSIAEKIETEIFAVSYTIQKFCTTKKEITIEKPKFISLADAHRAPVLGPKFNKTCFVSKEKREELAEYDRMVTGHIVDSIFNNNRKRGKPPKSKS